MINNKYISWCVGILLFIPINSLISQKLDFTSLFGEDWSKITYAVEVQPVFKIDDYKTIIISEIVNSQNQVDTHCVDLYDQLSDEIIEIEGLSLVDRTKTKSLLKEFKFQQSSGLVDENEVRKLGKFLGSGLIVFCRIQTDSFIQSLKKDKKGYRDASGCSTVYKRIGSYDLNVNFKIIDLETAKIIFSKTLMANIDGEGPKYDCQTAPELSPVSFYEDGKNEIGEKFRKLFTLHTNEYTIDFQTHGKFNDELKKAINYLEIDDFETGYSMIKEIPAKMEKEKAKSAALYNLAMMQKYNGEYEVSLKNAKEAYMLNPKNNSCLEIINELK